MRQVKGFIVVTNGFASPKHDYLLAEAKHGIVALAHLSVRHAQQALLRPALTSWPNLFESPLLRLLAADILSALLVSVPQSEPLVAGTCT